MLCPSCSLDIFSSVISIRNALNQAIKRLQLQKIELFEGAIVYHERY